MKQRTAFTLPELLVALALIVLMMTILAQIFAVGQSAMNALKATTDLDARMRVVTGILRADLTAAHFEPDRRLSDANFLQVGSPRQGFFRIRQGSAANSSSTAPYVNEAQTGTALPATVRRTIACTSRFGCAATLRVVSCRPGYRPQSRVRPRRPLFSIPPSSTLSAHTTRHSRLQSARETNGSRTPPPATRFTTASGPRFATSCSRTISRRGVRHYSTFIAASTFWCRITRVCKRL